jgi:hypothetical protein
MVYFNFGLFITVFRAPFFDHATPDYSSRAAQNRCASNCHPERAAAFAVTEGPKSAKPTFAALCLCPSASSPPPIDVLLQTKGEPQFDRTVTERSTPLFFVFSISNCVVSSLASGRRFSSYHIPARQPLFSGDSRTDHS